MEAVSNSRTVISIRNDQGTEVTKLITTTTAVPSSQVPELDININNVASTQPRFPTNPLLNDDQETRKKYLGMCVPLHKAALRGDWESAKKIIDEDRTLLTTSISTGGFTVLHLAAGSENVHFVEQLVAMMSAEDLELRDEKGNTALCLAAVTGIVEVAQILLRENSRLATMPGGQGMMPLYMAALFGKSEMAWYLYGKTNESCGDDDRRSIFFSCINTAIYDLALKMVQKDSKLATARDKDDKTALHLLAKTPEAFANVSSQGWSQRVKSCLKSKFKRNVKITQALDLVKYLWEQILILGHDETIKLVRTPELLFDATKMGNFEFLSVLLNSYPDLVWEYDSQNRTIIHIAVMYRHANIYNLKNDIGPIKEIIATYEDAKGNNILHLAAKLPPSDRLKTVSGPALQMQQELLWFKEVERIVQPLYVKNENKNKKIPEQLFSHEHKNLLRTGEQWMKSTATSCMIVATLITTVVFTAASALPGGNNDNNGDPNEIDHQRSMFLIFILSDGLAFISSIVSIMMFLSILTSRYAESDFQKSLPLKLMIGLASLFFSIATMVIAFSSTIVIACHHGLKWVPYLISVFAFIPVALFVVLQFHLLFDTFSSTYWSRTVFQPTRRMLY